MDYVCETLWKELGGRPVFNIFIPMGRVCAEHHPPHAGNAVRFSSDLAIFGRYRHERALSFIYRHLPGSPGEVGVAPGPLSQSPFPGTPAVLLGIALSLALFAAAARIRLLSLIRRTTSIAWFVITITATSLFFVSGTVPFEVGGFYATAEGAELGLVYSGRIVLLLWLSTLFAWTTSTTDMIDGVAAAFRRFQGAGSLVVFSGVAITFVPLLVRTAERVRLAQIARGAPQRGGFLPQVKLLNRLAIHLYHDSSTPTTQRAQKNKTPDEAETDNHQERRIGPHEEAEQKRPLHRRSVSHCALSEDCRDPARASRRCEKRPTTRAERRRKGTTNETARLCTKRSTTRRNCALTWLREPTRLIPITLKRLPVNSFAPPILSAEARSPARPS
jgi:hypothetical protein